MIQILKERLASLSSYSKEHEQVLNIADEFIVGYPDGVSNEEELDFAISLFHALVELTYLSGTREFENNHKFYRTVLHKKIQVFKKCIPKESRKVRGLTELLLGMKENELG